MFYVYFRHLKSDREDFCGAYDNPADAVKKIANNYSIDLSLGSLGEYYYFMKHH